MLYLYIGLHVTEQYSRICLANAQNAPESNCGTRVLLIVNVHAELRALA